MEFVHVFQEKKLKLNIQVLNILLYSEAYADAKPKPKLPVKIINNFQGVLDSNFVSYKELIC